MTSSYYIFLLASGLMIFLYFLTCRKLIDQIAEKFPEAYEQLGRPHFIKDNRRFLKYIKEKDYQSLNDDEIDSLGQAISFLYYAGTTLLLFSVLVFFALAVR